MAKFALSSDSSCDLYLHTQKQYDIVVASLSFTREKDGEIVHGKDNFKEMSEYIDFYNKIDAGYFFKTSQINTFAHKEHFQNLINERHQDIVHFSLSSGLSGTAEAAKKAAEEINQTSIYKVYAIDSLSATVGIGQLVLMAKTLRDENKSAKEVYEYFEKIKHNLHHWFFVSDLMHLKRGGRISTIQAVVGSALKIRPMLMIDKAGKLQVISRIKGDKKAINTLIDYAVQYGIDLDNQTIHITHTNCPTLAEELKNALSEVTSAKVNIIITGPTIGAHMGSGALGITFLGKERCAK